MSSLSTPAAAQQADAVLEEIIVSATRIPADWLRLPVAASLVGPDVIDAGRQAIGLDEVLGSVPGLFFQNRYNFAQDLRVSIRGFGARANFGIRGIKLYADGIPLTMPDGQGNVDSIDLGSAERIEVIRGPVSAVYGAAGGGVIRIHTQDGPQQPEISARGSLGSYDYGFGQLKFGGQFGAGNLLLNLSSTRLDGYRDHSEFEQVLFNSKLRVGLPDGSELTVVLNAVDSPRADDPGALTAAETASNRRQAAARNVQFNAGESLDQQQAGFSWRKPLTGQADSSSEVQMRGYAIARDFQNFLPFDINSNGQGGSVNLDRKVAGLGGQWSLSWGLAEDLQSRLVVGFDLDEQRDLRERFANNQGIQGALTTRQDEDVSSRAVFIESAWQMGSRWTLTLGGRYDDMRYRVRDRLAATGVIDGSGRTEFGEFSPMVGVSMLIDEQLGIYANISTAFDPPAISELANPEAPTGFNQSLDPQTATNFELGLHGRSGDRWQYELALFHINVSDEIVPFELAGSGQSFFQNAGSSTHRGIEAALKLGLRDGLDLSLSYTFSDLEFDRFVDPGGADYAGNRIPGIPEHQAMLDLAWNHESGIYAGWDALFVGSMSADNANTVTTDSYIVSNLRLGYRYSQGSWSFEPFAGVYNLFDETYNGNIRINAAFGRYFEPAPERNAYAGFQLGYRF